MKQHLLIALIVCALAACSPASQDIATSSTAEPAASAATDTMTSEPAAAMTTAQPPEEKPMSHYQDKVAEIQTTNGNIVIRFFGDKAPNHVKNFIDLAEKGFYDGTKFHRIIPNFMIQGGDPNTKSADASQWGFGGSGKNVAAEFNDTRHVRGIVSAARSQDPNSASSQFFIVVGDASFLDRQYSAFGQVVSGMDVADKIVAAPRGAQDRPNDPVAIQSIKVRAATPAESAATK